MTDGMSLGRQQAGQLTCTLTGPPQWGHGIASRIGVDQSLQGLDHLGVMLDQRLPPASGVAHSLSGEGVLSEALNGPIDGRARESGNPGDQGNTSSSQSLAIDSRDEVLLSLIEMRKQQAIFPLKFVGWAHSGIIPTPLWFVTTNFLRTLMRGIPPPFLSQGEITGSRRSVPDASDERASTQAKSQDPALDSPLLDVGFPLELP